MRIAVKGNPLTVEHICSECDLFYQCHFTLEGTREDEATGWPRLCVSCEEPVPVYRVIGGEFEYQPALFEEVV